MNKIVLYLDWTDIVGHLTSFYSVCEDEENKTEEQIKKEKEIYLKNNLDSFFSKIKRLRNQGYEVDCHVLTGGTRDYILPMFMELLKSAEEYGEVDVFKSLTLEYGSENIDIKSYIDKYGFEYQEGQEIDRNVCALIAQSDPRKAFSEEITEKIKKVLSKNDMVRVNVSSPYNFMHNIVLDCEDITQEDFEDFCKLVRKIYGSDYTFYEYYCPGYGVEIDIVAPNNDKANGVASIKKRYYKGKGYDVDLEVIVGDYKDVELGAINETVNSNVLVVATNESKNLGMTTSSLGADFPPHLMQSGEKLEALINALEKLSRDIKNYDGFGTSPFSKYDIEDFVY